MTILKYTWLSEPTEEFIQGKDLPGPTLRNYKYIWDGVQEAKSEPLLLLSAHIAVRNMQPLPSEYTYKAYSLWWHL